MVYRRWSEFHLYYSAVFACLLQSTYLTRDLSLSSAVTLDTFPAHCTDHQLIRTADARNISTEADGLIFTLLKLTVLTAFVLVFQICSPSDQKQRSPLFLCQLFISLLKVADISYSAEAAVHCMALPRALHGTGRLLL